MHILIIGGISLSLVKFRGPLIRAVLANGHNVTACAGEARGDITQMLTSWGVGFRPVNLARAGINPLGDLRTCRQLYRVIQQENPDIVLAYTIKPVIWGGIAARLARVPRIYSLITGLGYAFMQHAEAAANIPASSPSGQFTAWSQFFKSPSRTRCPAKQRMASCVAKHLYKRSLKYSRKVFFQNPDDRAEFASAGLVGLDKTVVVNGSGVDIAHFAPTPPPEKPIFLLVARLLADKGVREYADALRMLNGVDKGLLVGNLDPNPASISQATLDAWIDGGIIDHLGHLDDVRKAYEQCSVYVLPSYREGTPRTVLEAMAMGRPIITTDAPGCRETVRLAGGGQSAADKLKIGANGILIPPRDAGTLAAAMRFFIDHPGQIAIMGRESRRYAEERYDVHKVNAVILKEMSL